MVSLIDQRSHINKTRTWYEQKTLTTRQKLIVINA